MVSRRKNCGIGAVVLTLVWAAWFIASNFQLVQGWVTNLKASGGFAGTFIGAITHPAFYILLLAAAAILAGGAWMSKQAEIPAASTVQSQANPQNQNVTQSNPQNQSLVINNYSAQIPTSKAPVQVIQHHAEPMPNLQSLGPRTTKIGLISSLSCPPFFSAKGGGEEVQAFIVGFRNETKPGAERIAVPEKAYAQVLYYDADGQEIGAIVRACWLEQEGDLVDFELGHSLWLVVALLLEPNIIAPYYRRKPSEYGVDSIEIEDEKIDGRRLEIIEVRIIGESNRELIRQRWTCSADENGNPILAVRLLPLSSTLLRRS